MGTISKIRRAATEDRPEDSGRSAIGRSKTRLLSLGGCVTHDICAKAACLEIEHVQHLWRRPTIALMSRSPRRLPFLDADYPPELARYWQDDFRKSHREELHAATEGALVFDITRDVLCSLYEVEDMCFVIDPMSVKGVLWHGDHPDEEKVRVTLKQPGRLIHHTVPGYFEIWRSYFDDFAAIARRFDAVVLNKLYLTTRMASEQVLTHGDPAVADAANLFLEEAYDYIASTYDFIQFNAIPRKLLVTGSDVPWSGPTYTHMQHEATALFAERLREILLGDFHLPGRILVDAAISRMNRHEDLIRAHRQLSDERDDLAARLCAAAFEHRASLDRAEQQRDESAAEREALAGQLHVLADEHRAHVERMEHHHRGLAAERDALIAQLRARDDERDAMRAEIGRWELRAAAHEAGIAHGHGHEHEHGHGHERLT